jgi:hypothetical protein
MARYFKKWDDHSPRWQREKSRKGLNKNRWDAWLKLSDTTRKQSDPRKYAAGQSIAEQKRERKEREAVKKIESAATRKGRSSTVAHNVHRMTDADLDWTLKASPEAIRKRASMSKIVGYIKNPWWYM